VKADGRSSAAGSQCDPKASLSCVIGVESVGEKNGSANANQKRNN
jgi:hypothetical protein